MSQKPRRIGILYGMERTFPPALAERVNSLAGGDVKAEPLQVSAARDDLRPDYDVILDRISQDVPFYRTLLKGAAAQGAQVVNNPFWWTADDKFVCNIVARAAGVAVPRTVLLPHKQHPPGTSPDSFSNLRYPLPWEDVFAYLGFPIFLKPAHGGGWKDVHKARTPEEFFRAYDQTHALTMIAQEGIEFTEYYRCYCLGRRTVHIMRYEPRNPHHLRYLRNGAPAPAMRERLERDSVALCRALGYDFNTLEFAVRDGVPYAIDFMNPAPDADVNSVGRENFEWIVQAASEFLIDRARNPVPFEMTGDWPGRIPAAPAAPARPPARPQRSRP